MGLLNPGGPIAQFKRNRCSISPVEVILLSGVRSTPKRRAPRIVAVADDGVATFIQNRNSFSGQVQYSLYEEVFPAFAEVFAASPSAACARSTGRDGLGIEYSYDCVDYY